MKAGFEASPLNIEGFLNKYHCHCSAWLQPDQVLPCSMKELISSRNEALQIHRTRQDVPCETHTSTKGAQPLLFHDVVSCRFMSFHVVSCRCDVFAKVDPKWCPKARCQAPSVDAVDRLPH